MLIPNNKQRTNLFQYANTARFAYNWALEKEQENYKNYLYQKKVGTIKYKIEDITSDFSFSGIYKWTNEINKKVYIGQSINIYKRFLDYKKGRFNQYMKRAIDKYGIDNFTIEILERNIDEDKLDEYEQKWIDYYESYKNENGYNIAPIAGTTRGIKKSLDERMQMSIRASQRIGEMNPFYGKVHSDETKQKISKANSGKFKHSISIYQRERMNEGRLQTLERVKQIDKNNQEIIKIFESAVIASNETGVDYYGIRRCCRNKQKTAGGYMWEFVS